MGNAIWLTLAAWLLLFFSGCFYGIGRCCISNRSRSPRGDSRWNAPSSAEQGNNRYADQMRLDAVKAEADRKAAQKRGEVGLPAFDEYEAAQPLNPSKVTYAVIDGDHVITEDEHNDLSYRDQQDRKQFAGGYAQATPGTRAVDEYHNPSPQRQPSGHSTYPPQAQPTPQPSARRQGSGHSGYAPSARSNAFTPPSGAAVPPVPSLSPAGGAAAMAGTALAGQYLAPSAYGHQQYATGNTFGHGQDKTTCTYHDLTAVCMCLLCNRSDHSAHSQYPSQYYEAHDQANNQGHMQNPSFNPETYNATGAMFMPSATHGQSYPYAQPQPIQQGSYGEYHTPSPPIPSANDRSYTLGGGGYGVSTVPDHTGYAATSYIQPQPEPSMPSPGYGAAYVPSVARTTSPEHYTPASPIRGPRSPPPRNMVSSPMEYDDEPPQYQEAGGSNGSGGPLHPPGGWNSNEKH
jgi:hypothetical protein